ncbi:Methyltransferase-like protein 2-A [Bulinus truncatus]|nr:Methyltransferase-like protein 2-A [Bulinus truncatus]
MGDVNGENDTRIKFGTRFLTDPQNVFKHNAWDNVQWDEEQESAALKIALSHSNHKASQEKIDELERDAVKHWDQFYSIHNNHFFKDRQWLFTEFNELHGGVQESTADSTELTSIGSDETKDTACHKPVVGASAIPECCTFNFLEVGCGVGNTVFPILKTNKNPHLKVYCCDFSSTAIDIVKMVNNCASWREYLNCLGYKTSNTLLLQLWF